jgi:antitoxin HicB
MWNYPVHLEPAEEGGFVVTFPDIPEAITQGDDQDEALLYARDCLETALEFYVEGKRDLPTPSFAANGFTVTPSAEVCAKLEVYRAMREAGISKAELAQRLHWHLPQVDRLLDLRHASRFEQIEAALAALGKRLVVEAA